MTQILWIVFVLMAIIILLSLFLLTSLTSLWVQAYLSGAPVSLMDLIGMRFRKVDPRIIVHGYIMAKKADVEVTTPAMEAHHLAGGDLPAVLRAIIGAERARITLPWEVAAEIDLAGYDIDATTEAAIKDNLDAVTFDYAKKRGLRKPRTGGVGER